MTSKPYPQSLEQAQNYDTQDPLAGFRARFDLPVGVTYLVGHSLGPAPENALDGVKTCASQEWAHGLVGSWNTADWINLPLTTGARLARLLGVKNDEVIVCDSVSLNIFKLAASLLETEGMAKKIIVEKDEFPTDQYIAARLTGLMGVELAHCERNKGEAALASGGILIKSLVNFRTGEIADIVRLERIAGESGGAIIWDLSHAAGILSLDLRQNGAKYAVGCTYKYLNGGPGAPGYIYVRNDMINALTTPLPGWLGHVEPFAFQPDYKSGNGVKRFLAGTPPILSYAALNGSLDIFDEIKELSALQEKSNRLGNMCLKRFETLGLESQSPGIGEKRGGHVSFRHKHGYAVSRAWAARGHQTDFRTPDIIRLGLSPLFLGYEQVWRALDDLEDILAKDEWQKPEFQIRQAVT